MVSPATNDGRESDVTFDWRAADSMTVAIVDAVARFSGESPTEMEPLYSVIDPDALDSLFELSDAPPSRTAPSVTFPYNGVFVEISAEGEGRVLARG